MSIAKVLVSCGAICGLIAGTANVAMAHPGHGPHGFTDGFVHPLLGLDHLLATLAVGLLAVCFGGKALVLVPAAFLVSMLVGGLLEQVGVTLLGAEAGVAASVIVLGLAICASTVSFRTGLALVSLFAVFHGFAHAAETSGHASAGAYSAGFLISTAALHATGVLTGWTLSAQAGRVALRASGGLIAAAGVILAASVL